MAFNTWVLACSSCIQPDYKSLSVTALSTQQNFSPPDLPLGAAKARLEGHIFMLTLYLFWMCTAATAIKAQAPHIHICLQLHGQIPFDFPVSQRAFLMNQNRCNKGHTGYYLNLFACPLDSLAGISPPQHGNSMEWHHANIAGFNHHYLIKAEACRNTDWKLL